MAFTRIETGKDGRAVAKDMKIPSEIVQSEEEKAQALLEEKEQSRRVMFQELTPVHDLNRPHPRATPPEPPEDEQQEAVNEKKAKGRNGG